jgi:pheromone shutdown-related protein TraB
MTDSPLPDRVTHVTLADNRQIYLVGTAHVSKDSVDDVRHTVNSVNPDTICVELCKPRYQTLTQRDAWQKMDIFKVVREKKSLMLLVQLIMSAFYRQLGKHLDVQPGAEMLEGVDLAKKRNIQLVLADREIEITLKRVWGYMGFWTKAKLVNHLFLSLFSDETIDENMVETLKQRDQLEGVMAEFADQFPEIKHRLIDERDIYLAQKIREASGKTIVAVVGAGHCQGISEYIHQDNDLEKLKETPPPSWMPQVLKWGIPILIIGLFAYGLHEKGLDHFIKNIGIWLLGNGLFSAIGAIAAFAHPYAVIAAFFAAPFTSLNPMIGAGWVAGLVQAWAKRPTVDDFEDMATAIESVREFWHNPVTRTLLVVALANLGSVIGTYVSLFFIGMRTAN